jgi:hypothetical protein
MIEIWKDVLGYEGVYQVSNFGNVKRVAGYRAKVDRVLNCSVHRGYLMVTLSKYDVHNRQLVHRLIAAAFIPNPHNKPFINHIDGNPANNFISNLEWCTQKENIRHAHKIGNMGGVKHGMAKLKETDIYTIRLMYGFGESVSNIQKHYNRKRHDVVSILLGKKFKSTTTGVINELSHK